MFNRLLSDLDTYKPLTRGSLDIIELKELVALAVKQKVISKKELAFFIKAMFTLLFLLFDQRQSELTKETHSCFYI